MQPLACVCIRDAEECGIGDLEIRLVERDLREVVWISLLESVALDLLPTLGVERLMLPDEGVNQVGAWQVGTVNDDAVGVTAQGPTRGSEGERLGWRELESSSDKVPACALLE